MNIHPSMRGYFAYHLYQEMLMNENIWVITGDLGFGMFDRIQKEFPERFLNTGAAEVAMMDIAVGLALSDKIPVVYSITPFLLARPYEVIRNYIDYEELPVKMIGSGRNDDYKHDGYSHDAGDADIIISSFTNIAEYWPLEKEEMQWVLKDVLSNPKPCFVSLTR
jgi:transketolase